MKYVGLIFLILLLSNLVFGCATPRAPESPDYHWRYDWVH